MALFEPVWKTNKKEKLADAVMAVQKVSDPKKLQEIALKAHFPEVQSAALEQIRDPRMLRDIILTAEASYEIRRAAVSRISDPALLAEIAVRRIAYPADGEAVARLTDQTLLKQIALSEQGGEQDKAVYKITDPRDLAEIAFSAKKGDARKTAIWNIDSPDTLMDIISAAEEAHTRTDAHARMKDLLTAPENRTLSAAQKERYLNTIINEEDRNVRIDLLMFRDAEDLDRIFQKAVRYDLKAAALSLLVLNEDYPADSLLAHWKIAEGESRTVRNSFANPWQDARQSIEDRLEIEEINRPSLLLDFIRDSEVGSEQAANCLRGLFDEIFDVYEEIEDLRDKGCAVFLWNIPRYAEQDGNSKLKKYFLMLADAIPEDRLSRYGLSVFADEYRDRGSGN